MHGFTIIRKDSETTLINEPSLPSSASGTLFRHILEHVHKRPTGHLLETAFYYFFQNSSVFCFLVQIRAPAVLTLAEISKFKYESINEMYFGCTNLYIKYMTPSYKWPIASLPNKEGSAATLDISTHSKSSRPLMSNWFTNLIYKSRPKVQYKSHQTFSR